MFDYIIVGGGSAGCILASRLSDDRDVRVLLLEAGGPDDRAEIHIPAAFSKLFQTEADWNYHTVPQAGAANRALYWPRGKVLGGSSSINAMIYIRGHHADYDRWAHEGCTGWGYADVLPYFKRSEDNARGANAYHGVGGPLRVEDLRDPSPISTSFVDAAVNAGHPANDDFNGAEQEGAGLYQVTQRGGRRVSAASAFLRPARRRKNVETWTGAHVTRVLIEAGRAVGVEMVRGGRTERVRAEREVILSGGAVNSPQLLMLSGIGPAEHLAAHGIVVVADRPEVGENLQDHLIVGIRYRLKTPVSLINAESPSNVAQYLTRRRGMLTSNVAEAGLFARTRTGAPTPDLQFHVAPVLFEDHGLTPPTEHGFSLGPTLVATESRGRIRLGAADPLAAPEIDPGALTEAADVASLVEGVRLAREIAHEAALDEFRGEEIAPGAASTSRAEVERYVRQTCETLYHPVGTCRMGADPASVVDLDLRVRGVDGLRVIDASVMPTIPNGNTNAPTMMIAEKAADLIRRSASGAAVWGDGQDGSVPEVLSQNPLDALGEE